jgi:hypothetical protein
MALTKEEIDWALDQIELYVDDPCIDNYRFAELGDEAEEETYEGAKSVGCCGSFDMEVTHPNGKRMLIGCNYGH